MAAVARQLDAVNPRILLRELYDQRPRRVGAAVVDEDDRALVAHRVRVLHSRQHLQQARLRLAEDLLLVVTRDHDGERRVHRAAPELSRQFRFTGACCSLLRKIRIFCTKYDVGTMMGSTASPAW